MSNPQDNPIDKLFREGFEGQRIRPSARVWENIESGLVASQARKKALWLRWSLAASVAVLTGLGAFLFLGSPADPLYNVVQNESGPVVLTQENYGSGNEALAAAPNAGSSQSANHVQGAEAPGTPSVAQASPNPTPVAQPLVDPVSNAVAQNNSDQVDPNSNQVDPNANQVDPNPSKGDPVNPVVVAIAATVSGNSAQPSSSASGSNGEFVRGATQSVEPIAHNDIASIPAADYQQGNLKDLGSTENQAIADQAQVWDENLKTQQENFAAEQLKKQGVSQALSRFYAGVTYSRDFTSARFSGIGADQTSLYNEEENLTGVSAISKSSTHPEQAYSLGFQLGYQLSDKFDIQAGLNQSKWTATSQSVSRIDQEYITSRKEVIESAPVGQMNPPIFILANMIVTVHDTNNVNSFDTLSTSYSYEYVEIPLQVRYSLSNKKMRYYVMGGLSANFDRRYSAQTESLNGRTENIDVNSKGMEFSQLNGTFAVGAEYQFLPHLSFRFEPTLRQGLFARERMVSDKVFTNFALTTGIFFRL